MLEPEVIIRLRGKSDKGRDRIATTGERYRPVAMSPSKNQYTVAPISDLTDTFTIDERRGMDPDFEWDHILCDKCGYTCRGH